MRKKTELLNQYQTNKNMETKDNSPEEIKGVNMTKVVGYLLLSPALVSVLLFFIALLTKTKTLDNFNYSRPWVGGYDTGGFTSALPFYFGLMAIAGAYLIKDRK
jgi:hypothetical protein